MPNTCTTTVGSKITGQHLFLGASVISFTTNMAWGVNSTLTVSLVEDLQPCACYTKSTSPCPTGTGTISGTITEPFGSNPPKYPDDHYNTCVGDACYIDERGRKYDEKNTPPPQERVVPGKIYYKQNSNGKYVSQYWTHEDPGFFGAATSINEVGGYDPDPTKKITYDIIGTPVVFRFDSFIFAGVIKSWEVIANTGGRQFSVIIESMDSLLANSHMILSNYSGAIFAIGKDHSNKEEVEFLGMPTPYTGDLLHYFGRILSGCLHNVFNVYGFLESMNWGKFGGANLNESGIPAVKIIDALRVLTSCTKAAAGNSTQQLKLLDKQAFSPFGRLLAPVMANSATLTRITESFKAYAFGVIPPTPDEIGFHRNEFVLDLSELPRPSEDFRISGITITIAEFISQLTSATGQDYYTTLLPLAFNNKPYNIIKIRTIDRTQSSPKGQITNALNSLLTAGHTPTSATLGYEASNNNSRILVVGGPQQRLYQAKNYRLAYKQTSYIYQPITQTFVLYDNLPNIGKMKMPDAFSVRNKALSTRINGSLTELWNSTEAIAKALNGNKAFDAVDTNWTDTEVGGGSADGARIGNYAPSVKVFKNPHLITTSTLLRYIPIYMDTICPFFGYRFDQSLSTLSTDGSSNNFRYIRPVFLDSWTGCLNVVCDISELPELWIGRLVSLYQGGGSNSPLTAQCLPPGYSATMFVITETEMRAAMGGFDSYFSYCAAKSMPTKPDLFMMLVGLYLNSGLPVAGNNSSWHSAAVANLRAELLAAQRKKVDNPHNPLIDQEIAGIQERLQAAIDAAAAGLPARIAAAIAGLDVNNLGNVAGPPVPAKAGELGDLSQIFAFMINPNFLRDLQLLVAFVAELGSKYYGQQYMVKVPEMVSYQDTQFADIQLSSGSDSISVFQGSGKIYFNYEPCDAGAWEEAGNIIDDSILVGGADWFSLCNEEGLIPPILGYNASDLLDVTSWAICNLNLLDKASYYNVHGMFRYDFQTLAEAKIFQTCDEEKFRFKGLDISNVDPSEYIIKNTKSPRRDAFEKTIPSNTYRSKKLYIKSSLVPTPIFLDPINLRDPRIIVTTKGIPLPSSSLQYETDPNSMVISNVAIEDLSIYLRLTSDADRDPAFVAYMMHYVSPIVGNKLLIGHHTSNQSAGHQMLSPKMAQPFFAGVPVKSKQFTYGPWTNFPGLVSESIFPGLSGLPARQNAIENMIGKITVDIDDQLVPWKYGGMSFLDNVVLRKINTNTDYQNIIENASFSIAGVPIFGIGGQCVAPVNKTDLSKIFINNDEYTISSTNLIYKDIKANPTTLPLSGFCLIDILPQLATPDPIEQAIKIFNPNYSPEANATTTMLTYHILETSCTNAVRGAPCVSNLSITVGPEGFVTKYDLQTNSRKMGLFNKEFGDRLAKNASGQIKKNKEIQTVNTEISNLRRKQSALIDKEFKNKPAKPNFFGNSPAELLIGASHTTLRDPLACQSSDGFARIDIRDRDDADIRARLRAEVAKIPVTYGMDPGNDKEIWKAGPIAPNLTRGMSNQLRQETWIGSFQQEEAWDEMLKEFSSKSAMSLDGIYSPVSFYPTPYSSTFAMSSYPRNQCNLCDGKGYIEDQTVTHVGGLPSSRRSALQAFACPGCSRSINVTSSASGSVSTSVSANKEKLPPYIIASGSDASLLSSFLSSGGSTEGTSGGSTGGTTGGSGIPINLTTLQPIVVPYGLLHNSNVQTSGNTSGLYVDRCRHSIGIVARGEIPPLGLSTLSTHYNLFKFTDPATGSGVTTNGAGVNADYYDIDIIKTAYAKTHTPGAPPALAGRPAATSYLLNQRFFGLRGPITLHGWGYDTEGFPIPNAADEPKSLDNIGRPLRFELTPDNKNDLTKDGKYDPKTYNLGDIIGKGYDKSSGEWVKTKSPYFYLNWAERADLWPVGPIDLRWDEQRRVWAPANNNTTTYKMIYVTLEEDLVKEDGFDETYVARGFLDDVEYSTQALPANARRLVYIKDRSGFTAPRGAKLLCKYDADSGLYEPISKPTFMVFGLIGSGTSATLELAYIQGLKRGEVVPTFVTTFDNSKFKFKLTSGKTGMFMFLNGSWLLISVEQ